MKAKKIYFHFFVLVTLAVALAYTNCAKTPLENLSVSSQSACGFMVPAALNNPQTIDQAMNLIQAMPKPLTVDCFVSALKPPLKVFAVNSFTSAQPSGGENSPRIFIISGNLIMSVVPAGIGAEFLEFAEIVGTRSSVKGELQFPITQNITASAPYDRIREGSGTNCRLCHGNEVAYPSIKTGQAFASVVLPPDPFLQINQAYLKYQSSICNSQVDSNRCRILKAIYVDGQAQDVAFPE